MPDDSDTDPVGSEELFEEDAQDTEDESLLAKVLCERLDAFIIIFSLSMLFFVFGIISSLGTEPNSANNVIAVMNVVGAGFLAAVSLAAIVLCRVLGS